MRGVSKPLFALEVWWPAAKNQGKDGAPTQGCLDCSRNWLARQVALKLGGAVRFSDLHLTCVGRWRRSRRTSGIGHTACARVPSRSLLRLLLLSGNARLAAQDEPALTAAWLRQARVAGTKLSTDMNASAIERNLAALVQQNVSVVEADFQFLAFPERAGFRRRDQSDAPVRQGGASLGAEGRLVRCYARNPQREGRAVPKDHVRTAPGLAAARHQRHTQRLRRPPSRHARLRALGRSRHGERVDVDPLALRRCVYRAHQADRRDRRRRHLARRAAVQRTGRGLARRRTRRRGQVSGRHRPAGSARRRLGRSGLAAVGCVALPGNLELPAARARCGEVGVERREHHRGDRHARLRPCHAGRPRRQHPEERRQHHPGVGGRRGQRPDGDARGAAGRLDQPDRHGEVRQGGVRAQAVLDVRLWRPARRQPAGDGGGAGGRQQSVRDPRPRK